MKSEWKTVRLGDICEVVRGGSPRPIIDYITDDADGVNWLKIGDVNENDKYFTHANERIKRSGIPKTREVVKGDLILSNSMSYGRAFITLIDGYIHDGWLRLRCDEHVLDKEYLYYFLTSSIAQNQFKAVATGSVVNNLKSDTVKDTIITLPPLEVQSGIASFLSSIDAKLVVNNKINDHLYDQARTITKQWLQRSAGSYELFPLSEIAFINSDTYSPTENWEYVNYLDTSSITNGCISEIQYLVPSSEKLPSRAKRKIAPNDIVFSTVRPNQRHYGIISNPLPNMLCSTGFVVIRSKNPLVCNELIYLCITENEFIEKMQQLAEQSTSTFPSIKPTDLNMCEIPCPKDESTRSFTELLKSMFAKIAANNQENVSLARIRDSLLPKLMSGEIDVSEVTT